MAAEEFDRLVLEAVDQAFQSLGGGVTQALWYYIERTAGLRREEVPQRMEELFVALDRLLGPGALVLKRLIVRNLHSRLPENLIPLSLEDVEELPAILAEARRNYHRHSRREKGRRVAKAESL
jgi:hypothetical protein